MKTLPAPYALGLFALGALIVADRAHASPERMPAAGDVIRRIERVPRAPARAGAAAVEIELRSERSFPARGELPVLRVGDAMFTVSRRPAPDDMRRIVFVLTVEEFERLPEGAPVSVQYGRGNAPAPPTWSFGPLRRGLAR